jgi:multiple sugar transport system substrate-binding protein
LASRDHTGRVSRRSLLSAAAGGAGALALAGCDPRASATSTRSGQRVLRVWHSWLGVMAPRFKRILAAFEKSHPDIKLQPVFTPNNLATNQKFFTAVAAGSPPDVAFVDGPQVASWAEWGALEPLTQRIQSAGIKPDDYFPPTWRQCNYKGEIWGLTYSADPNFGFAWNRDAFRQAGLDPERPPTTMAELDDYSDRLTHTERGVIQRLGLLPWGQYGPANSIFTWGWVFGGEFYDPATMRITADHPRIVKALEWMTGYAKKYDPERITSLQLGFGTAENNPFYSGTLGMQCLVISGVGDIERYAPKLDYGVTSIPYPDGGEPRSSWVGGWCMSIPKGSRNPEDAWEFIRWLCHSPEGTSTVGREAAIFPGMRRSPYFEAEASTRKHYSDYARILEESKHQRPVMPVQAYYMRELQRAVDSAVYGRLSPAEALARATTNTQAELDLALTGARPSA